ncbi:MAG: cyclase family protein [SAR202 cluster bacterium]|nr:cyclase family protein [SAR202 cluster bacterium]
MAGRNIPSKSEVDSYLEDTNWGRWGDKSSAGAINLITDEKRLEAVSLAKIGRTVSLSRPFPVTPAGDNPRPAQHYMHKEERQFEGGAAMDYYGVFYHGTATTHIDALCHVWDKNGMWEGKTPDDVIKFSGANFGTVEEWKDGILTRGVLLDVPKHRNKPYVTLSEPVHGWELEDIATEQNVEIKSGDAVFVYSGRDKYAADNNGRWGTPDGRPGLHASCLPFVKSNDIAILGWDMMDASPNEYEIPWTVHGVIFAYGVALVDNAYLEPLSNVCAEEKRYDFMLSLNPLYVQGGTGSPANPIATF